MTNVQIPGEKNKQTNKKFNLLTSTLKREISAIKQHNRKVQIRTSLK